MFRLSEIPEESSFIKYFESDNMVRRVLETIACRKELTQSEK